MCLLFLSDFNGSPDSRKRSHLQVYQNQSRFDHNHMKNHKNSGAITQLKALSHVMRGCVIIPSFKGCAINKMSISQPLANEWLESRWFCVSEISVLCGQKPCFWLVNLSVHSRGFALQDIHIKGWTFCKKYCQFGWFLVVGQQKYSSFFSFETLSLAVRCNHWVGKNAGCLKFWLHFGCFFFQNHFPLVEETRFTFS